MAASNGNGRRRATERKRALGMVAAGLAVCCVSGLSLLGLAVTQQNGVGDIVQFLPEALGSPGTHARIPAQRARASGSCVLDAASMLSEGGGLLVAEPMGERRFVVHWQGGATSGSAEDCGHSADLVLSAFEIAVLAEEAAGIPMGGVGDAGLRSAARPEEPRH